MAHALFLANLAPTLSLAGLIWTVQIVHYPLFAHVGPDAWRSYHAAHMRAITWVVAPLMTIELAAAIGLLVVRPAGVGSAPAWIGVALAAAVWIVTATVQVPQHRALSERFDPATVDGLVRWNWLRTGAWTARSALLIWMAGVMGGVLR